MSLVFHLRNARRYTRDFRYHPLLPRPNVDPIGAFMWFREDKGSSCCGSVVEVCDVTSFTVFRDSRGTSRGSAHVVQHGTYILHKKLLDTRVLLIDTLHLYAAGGGKGGGDLNLVARDQR